MNNENLIPISVFNDNLTREERARNASKAGKASAAARRRKKDMKAKMRMLLDMPVNDCSDYNMLASFGIDIEDIDNETLMLVGLFKKAKSGDVQAIKEIRNILGKDIASEELKIRKQELKLKQEAARSGAPGEQELPELISALSRADDEEGSG